MESVSELTWIEVLKDQKAIGNFYETLKAEAREDPREPATAFCNHLIGVLCRNLNHYALNVNTTKLVQLLIREPRYWLQRDYIIDNLVLGRVLELSQDRSGSHVVEASFVCASPSRLERLFNEVLYNYEPRPTGSPTGRPRTALEIMMFDQFGNYVVQHMYPAAKDVKEGQRPGEPIWFWKLRKAISDNRQALLRTTSGKQILRLLDEPRG